MPTEHRLDVTGYRGEPVPNTFVCQDATAGRLAVFLPGFGYSCDMPLFYYTELLLLAAGFDVLRVEYAYNRIQGFRELQAVEQRKWLLSDATAAVDTVLGQREYANLTLVGKSIGTRAMGHILTSEPITQEMRAVWLTPLMLDATLRQQMLRIDVPSLVVIGDADPYYDAEFLREIVEKQGVVPLVIPGGDHTLDIEGDAIDSVRALGETLATLATFLDLSP